MANSASSVLSIARGELGYSRSADPQRGTKYGRWYGAIYGDVYVETAWCYMFVSWCFNQAGAKSVVTPGAYCPTGVNLAKRNNKTVNKYNAIPGDIVFFDWEMNGVSDHIGICEENNGSYLTCIEGNTGGGSGYVKRRTREFSTITCVCRPDYGTGDAPVIGSAESSDPQKGGKTGADAIRDAQNYLKKWGYDLGVAGVDGLNNDFTRAALISYVQYNMNAYGEHLKVDGQMSDQLVNLWDNKYGPVYTDRYYDYGRDNYLYMVKAVQMGLLLWGLSIGPDGIDGSCGPATTAAIKQLQRGHGLEVDGVCGPATFKDMFRQKV